MTSTRQLPVESGGRISARNALLIGLAIVPGLLLTDGLFKEALFRMSPILFWAFDISKFVVAPALILVWLGRRHDVTPDRYGLQRLGEQQPWYHTLGIALSLSVLLYFVYHYLAVAGWRITQATPPTFTYQQSIPDGSMRYAVVAYLGLSAGLVEEIFFRGLPLLYMKQRFGNRLSPAWYVAGTSLLFGFIHWENGLPEVIATAAFGVAAACIYLRLRNLWPLIAAHALIDIWEFS